MSPAILLILCILSGSAAAEEFRFRALVTSVHDADTIRCVPLGWQAEVRVRLLAIDAPELDQPAGVQARNQLRAKVGGRTITVRTDTEQFTDRYGRILGHLELGQRQINRELVEEGWAWHYARYSDDAELANAQTRARESQAGLWLADDPQPPWRWRADPPEP